MAKMTKEERISRYPSKTFKCAKCGFLVVTNSSDKLDKRTKFCCVKCEKAYWKHPPQKI